MGFVGFLSNRHRLSEALLLELHLNLNSLNPSDLSDETLSGSFVSTKNLFCEAYEEHKEHQYIT